MTYKTDRRAALKVLTAVPLGLALSAGGGAIAADTPQTEMPEASGAAHSRLKPNHLRDTQ